MAFGERLKELREKTSLTQKELGEKLGISARLVSYYETNKNIPNDPTILNNIASIFSVSLDYLLGGPDTHESKIHQLVKKLTETTKLNKLNWMPFYDDNFNSWVNSFSLNVSSNKSYSKGDEIVHEETFYADYRNGSYVLVRIRNTDNQLYKTALFIYYNNSFVFYASDDNLSILEDLFMAVRNQVLGIETFIDEFLNEDFSKGNSLGVLSTHDAIPF